LKNSSNDSSQRDKADRPSMCRSCGSIIGAGQKECAVCGVSATSDASSQPPRMVPDRETLRFARAVLTRPYKFTIILLVINVFVFLVMWQTSGIPLSMLTPLPNEVLLAFGAKLNYLIQSQHEWWRLVTPMFLHVNLLHLVINMYSLWVVGPYVERLYGSAKFVLFWVVTGVAGVIASYLTVRPGMAVGSVGRFLFKTIDTPSAGASGALFGLVGVLFVFGIKFRHELPEGFKRAFGTGLLPMILMNLFIGYLLRGLVDNAAHLGGLLSGAMLALVVDYRRPDEKTGGALTWRILQGAAVALVAVSFFKTAQHLSDSQPGPQIHSVQLDPNARFIFFAQAMNEAGETLEDVVKEHDATSVDNAVKALESTPSLDPKADELRDRLKSLLLKAKSIYGPADPAKPSEEDLKQQQSALKADFNSWIKEYNIWLKTTGKSYGLEQVTEPEPPPK
jgi:rhomboid protease GluP